MYYRSNSATKELLSPLRLIIISALLMFSFSTQAATPNSRFDHFQTGFPLTGQHQFVDCASCHLDGQFKGAPLACGLCHNGSRAPGKNPLHFRSSDFCDDCHTENSWSGARFEHSDIQEPCLNCHNNHVLVGKSVSHILSTSACEDCHNTISFDRVGSIDHTAVIGTCSSCHNGITATGKHAQHINTNDECDSCHSTTTWRGARFDHSNITAACSSCHNGSTATGKHAAHIITTAECDTCHNTSTWLGASFDHSTITGSCSSCHNGSTATGKGTSHFDTTLECDRCHTTSSWSLLTFSHDSPNYPGDHTSARDCVDCHTSNSQLINWPFSAYKPECAGCHANDFEPGAHKGPGDVLIPINDLIDCSGLCHLKDGDRSNEHRVNSTEW